MSFRPMRKPVSKTKVDGILRDKISGFHMHLSHVLMRIPCKDTEKEKHAWVGEISTGLVGRATCCQAL